MDSSLDLRQVKMSGVRCQCQRESGTKMGRAEEESDGSDDASAVDHTVSECEGGAARSCCALATAKRSLFISFSHVLSHVQSMFKHFQSMFNSFCQGTSCEKWLLQSLWQILHFKRLARQGSGAS